MTSKKPSQSNVFRVASPTVSWNDTSFFSPHTNPSVSPKMPIIDTRPKVIFIIGATAVGKTKLSLDLCEALAREGVPAEIINADSMQVYRGFSVGTAKATKAEQERIKHHLLDECDASDGDHSVRQFLEGATEIIENLTKDGILPVVVGGTAFYIQSLLWSSALDIPLAPTSLRGSTHLSINATPSGAVVATPNGAVSSFLTLSVQEAHEKLQQVDPIRASQLHPNDYRRVLRSLEVFHTTGLRHGELIQMTQTQSEKEGFRYQPCILWLDCANEELFKRIDKRVDDMLRGGLLGELKQLRELLLRPKQESDHLEINKATGDVVVEWDQSKGILQSIGYKEFGPIVTNLSIELNDPCSIPSDILECCLTSLRKNSRSFVRKQKSWIKSKFLIRQAQLPIHRVEADDVENWDETVLEVALSRVRSFLDGNATNPEDGPYKISAALNAEQLKKRLANADAFDTKEIALDLPKSLYKFCDKCSRTVFSEEQWKVHLKSKQHRKSKADIPQSREVDAA